MRKLVTPGTLDVVEMPARAGPGRPGACGSGGAGDGDDADGVSRAGGSGSDEVDWSLPLSAEHAKTESDEMSVRTVENRIFILFSSARARGRFRRRARIRVDWYHCEDRSDVTAYVHPRRSVAFALALTRVVRFTPPRPVAASSGRVLRGRVIGARAKGCAQRITRPWRPWLTHDGRARFRARPSAASIRESCARARRTSDSVRRCQAAWSQR